MRAMRVVVALVLVLAVAAGASAAEKARKAHKARKEMHGVIVAVEKDKNADSGTMTLKLHARKHRAVAAKAGAEKTIKFDSSTRFVHARGARGKHEGKALAWADLRKGQKVLVRFDGDMAKVVKFKSKARGETKARMQHADKDRKTVRAHHGKNARKMHRATV